MLFDPFMHLPVPFARSIKPALTARPARQSENKLKLVANIALESQHDQICGTSGSLTYNNQTTYVHIYRAPLGYVSIPAPGLSDLFE